MTEEFIIIEKFRDKTLLEEFSHILTQNSIKFIVEDNSLTFNPTFTNDDLSKEFLVKVKQVDFNKVNEILMEKTQKEFDKIGEIEKDYYLFSFTDEELMDLLLKSDEWSKYDVLLAKKILKEKGKEVTQKQILEYKQKRILQLSQPEKKQTPYVVIGYISAFLGGLLGVFIGWHLMTHKKTLPNGTKIYAYSDSDRNHGNRIVILATLFIVLWVLFRILK